MLNGAQWTSDRDGIAGVQISNTCRTTDLVARVLVPPHMPLDDRVDVPSTQVPVQRYRDLQIPRGFAAPRWDISFRDGLKLHHRPIYLEFLGLIAQR
jgi:hypothetical protein